MDTKYDQSQFDVQAQQKWESEKTYHFDATKKDPLFSIDTPPPTVSGTLHIGHIFSYTQTDIIARYKRLMGFNVLYPFGFDDNGLPTERFVEKTKKITEYGMKRSEFIKLCLDQSQESIKEFTHLWKRMGISADWTKTYSTISPEVQKISQASFLDLQKKGFIYRKQEPALYCTSCFTSVAQAELDDKQEPSQFNDIIFKTPEGENLVVATTRPELLYSCVALFYHPEDNRYQHLKNKQALTPIAGQLVPILPDDLVEKDKGTGLVMCCTFGDKTDILWFKKHKLKYRPSIGFDGKWLPQTNELAGLRVTMARKKIIELLQNEQLLQNQKQILHNVNVHERCKKSIEYIVLNQWFLNILEHKQDFLKEADRIEWSPLFMKSRYKDWVEHLQWDWCLSRQRFYGIPFPAWHCQDCKNVIFATHDQLPVDPQETLYTNPCPECGSSNIKGDTDVMDTWNTSSLTPYICAQLAYPNNDPLLDQEGQPNFLPMSMRPQAHDIIRTWAFYTIIKSWLHHKTIPWKSIVISGHVLSSEKDKISKSQGNNPLDPEQLLQRYPADAIRYWTASGTLGQDVAFSENQLKIGLKLQTKLWNAFRFIKEHVNTIPNQEPAQMGTINEWILDSISNTNKQFQKALDINEFGHGLQIIERFFWHKFCDNYLEVIKDQLINPDKYDALQVIATRWTLAHVGKRILQLFAPYLPHITETIYNQLFDSQSLHTTRFDQFQTEYNFNESNTTAETIIAIISIVRKLKTEEQLSLKTELSSLTLHCIDQNLLKVLVPHEQLLKGITKAQAISYSSGGCKKTELTKQGQELIINLDLDAIKHE